MMQTHSASTDEDIGAGRRRMRTTEAERAEAVSSALLVLSRPPPNAGPSSMRPPPHRGARLWRTRGGDLDDGGALSISLAHRKAARDLSAHIA